MKLHPKKIEHLNKKAIEIIDLLEETVEEKGKSKDTGSLAEKKVVDWTDKLVDSPYKISTTFLDEKIEVKECYKGKCIGFNEENYIVYKKFIESLANDSSLSNIVSLNFILENAFDWFVQVYRDKKINFSFCDYIIETIEKAIENFKIYFPIANLDIGKYFNVGNVSFEFFTKEKFSELENRYKNLNPDDKENPYVFFRNKYQGVVFATYKVRAEKEKAKELALKECALAIDVIKICSDTTYHPKAKLSFEMEIRAKELLDSSIIFQKADSEAEFTMDLIRIPSHHKIYEKEWHQLNLRKLGIFHNFLCSLKSERTELEQLIINGISRYGLAISNPNLYQRIVELFTIMESLLLKDKSSPIIDSVCTYCSKLIAKNTNHRKEIIQLLKRMYNVRSDLIHHGKESSIEMKELGLLQVIVVNLLISLINRKEKYKDKHSILDEIDDAILGAY